MKIRRREELDISIVMPCLNEEKTVGSCVDEASDNRYGICNRVCRGGCT
ncbi:MAG: hypothetical protein IJJ74_00280 [Eubacterium sp.]|nr:hypothetical protein [Eubacterium sp.]